jgi:hypothetical protein
VDEQAKRSQQKWLQAAAAKDPPRSDIYFYRMRKAHDLKKYK